MTLGKFADVSAREPVSGVALRVAVHGEAVHGGVTLIEFYVEGGWTEWIHPSRLLPLDQPARDLLAAIAAEKRLGEERG